MKQETANIGVHHHHHHHHHHVCVCFAVQARGLEVVPLLADGNLVDAAWGPERPGLPEAPMRVHDLQWAGQNIQQKLTEVRTDPHLISGAAPLPAAGWVPPPPRAPG
jgi:hypothetical protein